MNTTIKMFLNLTVLGTLAGVILAGVFYAADPLIQANKEKELKEAIFVVLPEAKDYVAVTRFDGPVTKGHDREGLVIYIGLDDLSDPVGLAFRADGNGFQGNIGVMVGLDTDYMKLKGIEILDQLETPGLGERIRSPEFKEQFKGVSIAPKIEYIKYRKPTKPNRIQAITGATISSEAVVKNINRAVARVLSTLPKEQIRDALKEAMAAAEAQKQQKKKKKKKVTDGKQ